MGLFSLARQFILRENIVIILQRGLKKLPGGAGIGAQLEGPGGVLAHLLDVAGAGLGRSPWSG